MSRIVSWFSCGAASAVATKLAIAENPEVIVAYCEVAEEHPDNKRFLLDCQEWFGQEIVILGNPKYNRSIYEVFEKTRYLVGPTGARCTGELKKNVRIEFEQPGDINVFGFTMDEEHRLDRIIDGNSEIQVITPLIDHQLSKEDCLAMVANAGIEIPAMYKLGFKNNNCMGCVKATGGGYWRLVQKHFPEMFERMNKMEKHLGRAVCQISMPAVKKRYPEIYDSLGSPVLYNENGNANRWRPQLHELPDDIIAMDDAPDFQCGIFCMAAESIYD